MMDRFWSKVDRTSGPLACWEWKAYCRPTIKNGQLGYGHFRVGDKVRLAHNVAFVLANGSIPQGMKVLHSCDNPKCCNPNHLFIGTQKDNVEDAIKKGRHKIPAAGCVGGLGSVQCLRST